MVKLFFFNLRKRVINGPYYKPSTFYIVKLRLALGNIFNWTKSIIAQSHDNAKTPYRGINMDFWPCLIVMTYRNCALFFLLVSTWLSRFKNRYETPFSDVFYTQFGPKNSEMPET